MRWRRPGSWGRVRELALVHWGRVCEGVGKRVGTVSPAFTGQYVAAEQVFRAAEAFWQGCAGHGRVEALSALTVGLASRLSAAVRGCQIFATGLHPPV